MVLGLVAIVIFVIGAVVGAVLRFKVFLCATLIIGAAIVILAAFRGLDAILMSVLTAMMFVILMLAGAAIGRTLKQAFREG